MKEPGECITCANTILYCANFEITVAFYRDVLGLPILFTAGWFVEFKLEPKSHLSIADASRTSIRSCSGNGITLSLEVTDIDGMHKKFERAGANPTVIKKHPWAARFFFIYDPDGHRLEFWTPSGN